MRTTWLTPYLDIWKEVCGGDMAAGQAAKALAPLHAKLGPEETLVRWTWYLRSTPVQYASVSRFAQTHGRYAESAQPEIETKGLRPATQGRVV